MKMAPKGDVGTQVRSWPTGVKLTPGVKFSHGVKLAQWVKLAHGVKLVSGAGVKPLRSSSESSMQPSTLLPVVSYLCI
jgi:hypothetical protein